MSVLASVVMLIPPVATKVSVSLLLSATTVDCPLTAIFLNILCDEPLSELVTVTVPDVPPPLIPVPAVTPVISPTLEVQPALLLNILKGIEEISCLLLTVPFTATKLSVPSNVPPAPNSFKSKVNPMDAELD